MFDCDWIGDGIWNPVNAASVDSGGLC